MTRVVPVGYVLLAEAHIKILGEECEFIGPECRLTEEERRYIELSNRVRQLDEALSKNRIPYPEEYQPLVEEVCSRRRLKQSVAGKLYNHEDLRKSCNERIRQTGGMGALDAQLITSEHAYPLLAEDFMDGYKFDDMCKSSQGTLHIPGKDKDTLAIVRGDVVVSEVDLARIQKKFLDEMRKHDGDSHSGPNSELVYDNPKNREAKSSGAAGRPTSWHLVEPYLDDRIVHKICKATMTDEAKHLSEWLSEEYPNDPRIKPRTMQNKIGAKYRAYQISLWGAAQK